MDGPRLTRDPTQDTCPDYEHDPDFEVFVNSCMSNEQSQELVVQGLVDAWHAGHTRQVNRWEVQLEEDRLQAQQEAEEHAQAEAEARREAERERAKEKAEEEKKKFKPLPMDEAVAVLTHPHVAPLPFTMEKMHKYEYVELWYFMLEGTEEVHLSAISESLLGFGFAEHGQDASSSLIMLQPLSNLTKSAKATPDERLTFTQLSIAKTVYVQTMTDLGWPVNYVHAWAKFYTMLDNHKYQQIATHRDRTLVRYHAQVCWEWYHLLAGKKNVFNISIMNVTLLDIVEKEILWEMQLSGMNRTSEAQGSPG